MQFEDPVKLDTLMSIKTKIRDRVADILYLAKLTSENWRSRGRFSIVTFHRVLPETERQAYPFPGLVVTPEEFNAFLTYFTEHFDCGTLATQHQRYISGEITSRPLLAITFDDGQYDNYVNARPILALHQTKATFFIPVEAVEHQELLWHDRLGFAILTLRQQAVGGHEKLMRILTSAGLFSNGSHGHLGGIVETAKSLSLNMRLDLIAKLENALDMPHTPEFARLMTFDEITRLASDGHEIGSHSMSHCLMPECDDQSLIYELGESRRVLQAHVGQPIESFCYPNGNSDERTSRAVAKAGYHRAVTTTWGNNDQNGDQFQLRRNNMDARYVNDSNGNLIPAVLAFRMSGFYPGLYR